MNVLVLSDTHVSDASRLPEAVFELAARADHIIHAGDHSTLDVVHVLRAFAPVTAVRGNVEDSEVMHALPEQAIVQLDSATVGVRHIPGPANGRHQRLIDWMPSCDVRVYGHTHAPEIARATDGSWIINPGSPTQRRRASRHTVAWMTVVATQINVELVGINR